MTKISLLTLALFCAAATSFAQENYDYEATRIALADMRCDIFDERTLRWEAMNQDVILRTQITKDTDAGLPTGQLSLILENGTEIDLGGGQKYYDDGPIEDMLDCQKYLSSAVGATVASLSGSPHNWPTLKSLWDYMEYGKDCVDAQGRPKVQGTPSTSECQNAFYLHERYTEARPQSELSDQELIALRDSGAPLVTITRSVYYSETAVYDARTNKIHFLYYDGC